MFGSCLTICNITMRYILMKVEQSIELKIPFRQEVEFRFEESFTGMFIRKGSCFLGQDFQHLLCPVHKEVLFFYFLITVLGDLQTLVFMRQIVADLFQKVRNAFV